MKCYCGKTIKDYIEAHEGDIGCLSVGMQEDWSWTAEVVFNGLKVLKNLDKAPLVICGIKGSFWATPVMEVCFKDGRTEFVPCFVDDGETAPPEKIELVKALFGIRTNE